MTVSYAEKVFVYEKPIFTTKSKVLIVVHHAGTLT